MVLGEAMPTSRLWAVDVHGRVYSLSTADQQWEQCRGAEMLFKRVTAAQQCCWGIACDNKIHLNVHACDLHIRFQEETYENQVGVLQSLRLVGNCESVKCQLSLSVLSAMEPCGWFL